MKPTIHVLHMAHRTDREQSIIQQSVEQNFSIHWWEGEQSLSRKDTARAINTSHKRIIRYAKENKLPEILVAEDDCRFFGEGALSYFLEHKPKSYDLYMGVIYNGDIKEQRVVNGFSGGMTLYYVSSKFYNVFLNDIADTDHVDRALGNLSHKYQYKVPPKMVCYQSGGYSDNQKKVVESYSVFLENRLVYGRD